jgi:hypothetical protein
MTEALADTNNLSLADLLVTVYHLKSMITKLLLIT